MRWLFEQQLKSKKPEARRKALEKLGADESDGTFDLLLSVTSDPDPGVRQLAIELLGRREDIRTTETLVKALRDRTGDVRVAAAEGLLKRKDPTSIEALVSALRDKNSSVRWRAANALEALGWQAGDDELRAIQLVSQGKLHRAVEFGRLAITPLVETLREGAYYKRKEAVEALSNIHDPAVVKPLIEALTDEESLVRSAVVEALSELGDARAVDPLIRILRDKDKNVRANTVKALKKLGDKRAIQPLTNLLTDENWDVRIEAISALGKFHSNDTVQPLLRCLKDRDRDIRRSAVEALGKIGDPGAIADLVVMLTDESSRVRETAGVALEQINEFWATTPEAKSAIPALEAARKSNEYWVRTAATETLEKIENRTHSDEPEHLTTFANPVHLKRQAAVRSLLDMLSETDRDLRQAAAEGLSKLADPAATESLVNALRDSDAWVAEAAAVALDAHDWLPSNRELRAQQLVILKKWDDLRELGAAAIKALQPLLQNTSESRKLEAIHALERIQGPEASAELLRLLEHGQPAIREAASRALVASSWKPQSPGDLAALAVANRDWDKVRELKAASVKPLLATIRRRHEDPQGSRVAEDILTTLQAPEAVAQLIGEVVNPDVAGVVMRCLESLFLTCSDKVTIPDLQAIAELQNIRQNRYKFDPVLKAYVPEGSEDIDCGMLRQLAQQELAQREAAA